MKVLPYFLIFAFYGSVFGSDVPEVERWTATEFTFTSEAEYPERAAFYEVRMDVEFLSEQGTTLVMPAFWDGGRTWRVRFAPTEVGGWTYVTRCNESGDSGLHGQTGAFECVEYVGDCAVYRHGFVTTREGLKYFIYADGTPFFYLGDTHWGMMREEFDEPGPHAGNSGAKSHFRFVVDRRVEQGFTVFQSEPIGSTITYSDGINSSDVQGFQHMDRFFQYLAQKGLTHANAQFFYPSEMLPIQQDEKFLELISRYWVARYAAYPVLWMLGQEVDFDFYGKFSGEDNPYLKVCHWIHTYDPYRHPISAHMENTGSTTRTGIHGTHASGFQNVPGHTWYAVQMSRRLNSRMNLDDMKDFWNDGNGKVSVLYESLYCNLWTKDAGARMEGWMAFLNGLYGYGYGAADLWLYMSTYDMQTTSRTDGVSVVTPEDKAMFWCDALELDSARQVGFMRQFLESNAWWKLIPEFASEAPIFVPTNGNVFHIAAHDGSALYIVYFYSPALETGTLQTLDKSTTYEWNWFNPRTGESEAPTSAVTSADGKLSVPSKPDAEDWVLRVRKL